jgi:hypothetical protein
MVMSLRSKWAAQGNVWAYRRVGVSAFAEHNQLRRDLLTIIALSKSSFTSPDADTPIRRPADTLPQPPAHFQRNPPGRGQLAVFRRCSLDPYDADMGASLAP